MKTKSIKRNYIYNVLNRIFSLITPVITAPYISRVLEADGIGIYSYISSIAAYFTLVATLGITQYGQREISYVQDKIEKRTAVFWETKILEFCTSGIALFFYMIFIFYKDNSILYFVFALEILAVMFDVSWFFQGIEEFGKIVFRNIIIKILNISFIFLFVRDKNDLVVYAFGSSFFVFLNNISLWGCLTKYLCKVSISSLHPFRNFKVVLSLFIPEVAIQIYTVLDKTMLGIIGGNSFENGYYEQAMKISKMVLTLVTSLGIVVAPRIGFFYKQEKINEVRELMYNAYRFIWMAGMPLCVGLILVSSNFVPWFFGNGYEKVALLLKILAPLVLAIGFSNATGIQYLIQTQRQNLVTITVILGAFINFILNLFLIPVFQSVGASVSSVIAEFVVSIVQMIMIRKEISLFRVVIDGSRYFAASGVMAIFLTVLGRNMSASIIHTFILVGCGGLVYVLSLVIMKDAFLITNLELIIKGVRSGKRK